MTSHGFDVTKGQVNYLNVVNYIVFSLPCRALDANLQTSYALLRIGIRLNGATGSGCSGAPNKLRQPFERKRFSIYLGFVTDA